MEKSVAVEQVIVVAGCEAHLYEGWRGHKQCVAPPPCDDLDASRGIGFGDEPGHGVGEGADHFGAFVEAVEVDVGLSDCDVVGMVPAAVGRPAEGVESVGHGFADGLGLGCFPGGEYSGVEGSVGPVARVVFGVGQLPFHGGFHC